MPTTTRDVAINLGLERKYQTLKHGDHPHSIMEWIAIMKKELAEAEQAWLTGRGPDADIRALEELLQATAVGVAALEQHGCHHEQKHIDFMNEHQRGN